MACRSSRSVADRVSSPNGCSKPCRIARLLRSSSTRTCALSPADAGYDHLSLDVLAFHSDELGLQAFLPQYDPERYRAFVVPGGLSADEWENYRQAYSQFLATADVLILQLMLLASRTKP